MSTAPPINVTPTVADVAAMIRARTKDDNGNELGTFTDKTRPTEAQAQEAIEHAVLAVHEKVGKVGANCADIARLAATYGAAAEIELSYFPEQARTDRSPYQFLIARWTAALEGVEQCVLGNLPGTGEGGAPLGVQQGTLVAFSATAHDYYTGEIGVMGSQPPTPELPPTEGGEMYTPVVADHTNMSGASLLTVPTGTTAVNVSNADGTATLTGIQIDGKAPPDGYQLLVRQLAPWPANTAEMTPADEEALVRGSVKLQLNSPAAGVSAIVELSQPPNHVETGLPLVGWLLTYVAAHKGWQRLTVS